MLNPNRITAEQAMIELAKIATNPIATNSVFMELWKLVSKIYNPHVILFQNVANKVIEFLDMYYGTYHDPNQLSLFQLNRSNNAPFN